jgi:hypothetical protein
MDKLSKHILDKIKHEHSKPRAKWVFQARNVVFWVLAGVAVILAGLFLAGLLLDAFEAEWEIAGRYPGGYPNFLLHTFSWVWLFGIAAAVAAAYVVLRKTKRGYRYGILALSGVILVMSFAFGAALLGTPAPEKARDLRLELHKPMAEKLWQNPEKGLLVGVIVEFKGKLIILSAIDQSHWEVDVSSAHIAPMLKLREGEEIKVIGRSEKEGEFRAEFVYPAKPPRVKEFLRKKMMK